MRKSTFSVLPIVVVILVSGFASANEPLVLDSDGYTRVPCEVANRALEQGNFSKFENPKITGTCSDVASETSSNEQVADESCQISGTSTLVWPVVAPMPWCSTCPSCDCTDKDWKQSEAVLSDMTLGGIVTLGATSGLSERPSRPWGFLYAGEQSEAVLSDMTLGGIVTLGATSGLSERPSRPWGFLYAGEQSEAVLSDMTLGGIVTLGATSGLSERPSRPWGFLYAGEQSEAVLSDMTLGGIVTLGATSGLSERPSRPWGFLYAGEQSEAVLDSDVTFGVGTLGATSGLSERRSVPRFRDALRIQK